MLRSPSPRRLLLGIVGLALFALGVFVNDVGKQSVAKNIPSDQVAATQAAFPTGAAAIHDATTPNGASPGHAITTTSHAGATDAVTRIAKITADAGTKIDRTEVAVILPGTIQVPS